MNNRLEFQKVLVKHEYLPYNIQAIKTQYSTRFCIVQLEDGSTYRVIDTRTGLCMSDAHGYSCADMFVELLSARINRNRTVARAFRTMTWDTILHPQDSKEGQLILTTIREVRRKIGRCMLSSSVTKSLKFKHRPKFIGGRV